MHKLCMDSLAPHMIMAEQIWSLNVLPSLYHAFCSVTSWFSPAFNFGLSEETCFGQGNVDGSDYMIVLNTHLKKSCAVAIPMKRDFLRP